MKLGFVVTSAINTRFGVFKTEERIQQTIDTIASIRARVPDAVIALLEMAGESLTAEQQEVLQPHVDILINFSNDVMVKEIYKNPNWDVVKSSTEMMCFESAIRILNKNHLFDDVTRVVKVSGRYLLNEDFNPVDYEDVADKIVFAVKRDSQFTASVTGGVSKQFMSRCWSFPRSMMEEIANTFHAMQLCMRTIVQNGGYLDIAHLLFLYISAGKLVEFDKIGVQGLLGPNGVLVRD